MSDILMLCVINFPKMRLILILILTIFPITIFAQIEKFNEILKIQKLPFYENEIRIYKNYSTSTGLEMFRFYLENEKWKVDFYETIASKKENQINLKIRKSKLNSAKNLELIWLEILNTDVIHLPNWEDIKYKLRNKEFKYEIIDGEILANVSNSIIIDGVSYSIQIKSGNKENEFEYSNPESYLKKYPNVDELISLNDLLLLVSKEFKIFNNN